MSPKRGEIYWIDWTPSRGSEQRGRRPGVVVSHSLANKNMRTCVVAAITTKVKSSALRVTLDASVTGRESQVLPLQLMTIANDRLERFVALLDDGKTAELDQILAAALGLRDIPK